MDGTTQKVCKISSKDTCKMLGKENARMQERKMQGCRQERTQEKQYLSRQNVSEKPSGKLGLKVLKKCKELGKNVRNKGSKKYAPRITSNQAINYAENIAGNQAKKYTKLQQGTRKSLRQKTNKQFVKKACKKLASLQAATCKRK